ncbi:MAG TPA: lytic transglycosylase domain-containing protein [Pyrinomonadaceae bacterium]
MRAAAHIAKKARKAGGLTSAFLLLVALCVTATTASGQQASPQDGYPYEGLLVSAARRYRLDLYVLRAQVGRESGYSPGAVSPKGARGLMQLMPATASRFGVRDVFDPAQSIEGGARYMRWLLDQFGGDYVLALAGYNAGEGAVWKYGMRVPPYQETQGYVANVMMSAARLRGGIARRPSPNDVPARLRAAPPAEATPTQPAGQETAPAPSSRYFFQ